MTVRTMLNVFMMVLIACSTGCSVAVTNFSESWKDPGISEKKLTKVAVVVVADKAVNRTLFEDEIVRILGEKGVDAVSGVTLIPPGEEITRESVEKAIQGKTIDSVLALRLIRIDEEKSFIPPHVRVTPGGYHGHFSAAGAMTFDPGYFQYSIAVRVESKLYDTSEAKLIWSVESETLDPDSTKEMMKSFCGPLVDQVMATGLF